MSHAPRVLTRRYVSLSHLFMSWSTVPCRRSWSSAALPCLSCLLRLRQASQEYNTVTPPLFRFFPVFVATLSIHDPPHGPHTHKSRVRYMYTSIQHVRGMPYTYVHVRRLVRERVRYGYGTATGAHVVHAAAAYVRRGRSCAPQQKLARTNGGAMSMFRSHARGRVSSVPSRVDDEDWFGDREHTFSGRAYQPLWCAMVCPATSFTPRRRRRPESAFPIGSGDWRRVLATTSTARNRASF